MSNNETYTLNQLQKLLGTPTELQAKANAPREPDAELIRLGAEISSNRILTDVEGLYGVAYAFWMKATDAQKDLLVGFSDGVLRYGVDRAIALRDLLSAASSDGFLDTKEVARRKQEAAAAFSEALSLRDRARNVLKKAAPDDATMREVDDAIGTAADDEKLAAALDRLSAIGQTLLETQDEVAKARLEEVRLTKTFVQQLSQAARNVRTTAQDAAVRTTAKRTTQGDIDRLDGVNLVLLREMVHTFEDAHEADPSIPRLVPTATRRLLAKRVRPSSKN